MREARENSRKFIRAKQTTATWALCLDAVQGSSEERVSRTNGTESKRQSVTDAAMRQER